MKTTVGFEQGCEPDGKGNLIVEYLCLYCNHITKRRDNSKPEKCPNCKRMFENIF